MLYGWIRANDRDVRKLNRQRLSLHGNGLYGYVYGQNDPVMPPIECTAMAEEENGSRATRATEQGRPCCHFFKTRGQPAENQYHPPFGGCQLA
ncbi:hypothetical protein GK1679 [Geobacillus kaustophilus HTA426]|uniref:Uncharacterized protein n=1 Tax=Geobacillus kaustophilus (strain HTA426) TaxID=235909 RepID=Q5KZC2_GEOKA|nr:hypothetical protein GK1679 [Geobacillus kaustophilus HTA426]